MKQTAYLIAFVVFLSAVPAIHSQAGDAAAIQQKLNSTIKLARITADRADIVTAGDVVQFQKSGLLMYAVASPLPPSNTYKNGRITQGMGGFGRDLMITMVTPGGGTSANYPQRKFVAEEKCWVTAIQVQKDGILLQLYSDPFDDVRYYANLKIPFQNKKEIPSADDALKLVEEVLTVVPQEAEGNQQGGDSQQANFSGTYTNTNPHSNSRYIFYADGHYTKIVGDSQGYGQFSLSGDTLTLKSSKTGTTWQLTVQGDKVVDSNTRQEWARTGDAPAVATVNSETTSQSTVDPVPGKYIRKDKSTDYLELGTVGTFVLIQDGKTYTGNYKIDGDTVILTGPKIRGAQKSRLAGNTITDPGGTLWVKPAEAVPAQVPTQNTAQTATPTPAETPMPEIAPPPPPADTPPPTIKTGESKVQVTTDFGQPLRMAKAGVKEIFFYKDMKVTFTNGKVTNIE